MTISAALVLFAVIWFMLLFVALPLRLKSQSEDGHVVPGTPASAPTDPMLKKKMKWVTFFALILWAIIYSIIVSGMITVEDFDVFHTLNSRTK